MFKIQVWNLNFCSKAAKELNDKIPSKIQKMQNSYNFKSKWLSSVTSGKLLENVSESHKNLQSHSILLVVRNLNESEIRIQHPLKWTACSQWKHKSTMYFRMLLCQNEVLQEKPVVGKWCLKLNSSIQDGTQLLSEGKMVAKRARL